MDYYQLSFATETKNTEPLIALLAESKFDAFQETETGFDTWIPMTDFDLEVEQNINELNQLFSFSFDKKIIKHQNWNAKWEADFHPIIVKDFCGIRANFHKPLKEVRHKIIIDPKMAFGTGHLAILAERLQAGEIDAVDIELPAYENTLENIRINKTKFIKVFHGTLKKFEKNSYDIILANINRHVILESFQSFHNMISSEGILLISGILTTDQKLVEEKAAEAGFKTVTTLNKNNWICSWLVHQ